VLKGLFGLEQLADDADFADTISGPLGETIVFLFVDQSRRMMMLTSRLLAG